MQLNENEIRGIIEEVIKRYAGESSATPAEPVKKEVEKRDDQKANESDYKQSLYGLNPGQEVKIFIEEGTLNKL